MLFIVKNYPGDMMKFEMASEMLELDNAMVIVNDDVALEDFLPAAIIPDFKARMAGQIGGGHNNG